MEYPHYTIFTTMTNDEPTLTDDEKHLNEIALDYLYDRVDFFIFLHFSKDYFHDVTEKIVDNCFRDFWEHRGKNSKLDKNGNLISCEIPHWVEWHKSYNLYLDPEFDELDY
jgi:hypothetical protein